MQNDPSRGTPMSSKRAAVSRNSLARLTCRDPDAAVPDAAVKLSENSSSGNWAAAAISAGTTTEPGAFGHGPVGDTSGTLEQLDGKNLQFATQRSASHGY